MAVKIHADIIANFIGVDVWTPVLRYQLGTRVHWNVRNKINSTLISERYIMCTVFMCLWTSGFAPFVRSLYLAALLPFLLLLLLPALLRYMQRRINACCSVLLNVNLSSYTKRASSWTSIRLSWIGVNEATFQKHQTSENSRSLCARSDGGVWSTVFLG